MATRPQFIQTRVRMVKSGTTQPLQAPQLPSARLGVPVAALAFSARWRGSGVRGLSLCFRNDPALLARFAARCSSNVRPL